MKTLPRPHPNQWSLLFWTTAFFVACGDKKFNMHDDSEGAGTGVVTQPEAVQEPGSEAGDTQPESPPEPAAAEAPTEPDSVPTPSGAPTSTSAHQGTDQEAVVGMAVAVPMGIRVRDANGNPVAGVEVERSVVEGNGQLERERSETGADGVALSGSWTLGPVPGRNEVKAEVPGLAPIFFAATGKPDARGAFTILRGHNLSGRVGENLAVAPTVLFLNERNEPVSGRSVSFAVLSGGGTVGNSTAVTDANGEASAGFWRLGTAVGPQRLRAAMEGMPEVEFSANAVSSEAPALSVEKVIGGLHHPWELVFLPDGSMLFTERGGPLSLLPPNAQTKIVLATPGDIPASQAGGTEQSGHLGLALDPDFSNNRFVYSFVSSDATTPIANRIRQWRLSADFRSIEQVADILTGLTYGSNGGHSGGRIVTGPDGHLYITTGDTRSATVPQNLALLGGKVLRITTSGAAAPQNPNLGEGARPEIFAYGFRNPQGLAFRPASFGGGAFTCEHGPNQDDEVTQIVAGGNGGWDPHDGNGNYNGYSGAVMTDFNKFPDAMAPVFKVSDSNGMSDCIFLEGAKWKSWEGSLAVGLLAGQAIEIANIAFDGTGLIGNLTRGLSGQGRIRSLTLGPDQNLYVVIDASQANDGRILRVTPN